MRMMMKMMVQQAKSQDKFFERTGHEEESLNHHITKHNLQADPVFMKMVQDNMAQVMAKAQAAQGAPGAGGMGGGMGGGMPFLG
jgi:hypothetical protein